MAYIDVGFLSTIQIQMGSRYYLKWCMWKLLLSVSLTILYPIGFGINPAMAEEIGIQPLVNCETPAPYALVPTSVRPLFSAQELETFLQNLEGSPPDWTSLRDTDHQEQSKRLFTFNRERDQARLVHQHILHQPLAFVWSGILRQYLPEYQGFSVALGPNITSTTWGSVRFKPMGLPDYLVATLSSQGARDLLVRQQQDEHIDIVILFIGTLVSDESLMYAFSHDGEKEGMILPVVHIQNIRYCLP